MYLLVLPSPVSGTAYRISTATQFTPFVLRRYYGCDSVIPVIMKSKLKILFQARKSPRGA